MIIISIIIIIIIIIIIDIIICVSIFDQFSSGGTTCLTLLVKCCSCEMFGMSGVMSRIHAPHLMLLVWLLGAA